MAFIAYNKIWESEFDNIVSKKDKVWDLKINQLKLEVNDAYKKTANLSTDFEPSDDTDVINIPFLDKKLSKTEGHISYKEKK